MNQAFHDPSIDPQLGARLVALVLGEASDFERDELNRLIAERPELARYRDEIQQVHDLLDVVGKGEMSPPEGEWKLAADKRAQLLRVLSGEANKARAALSRGRTPHRPFWRNRILMGVASAAALLFVVTFYAQVQVRVAREAARVARATSAPMDAAVER